MNLYVPFRSVTCQTTVPVPLTEVVSFTPGPELG
jgi:hypothetical protein